MPINGFDRVTEVLSPFSGLDKVPSQILYRAQLRGEMVHRYIQAIIDGIDVIEIDEPLQGYINSFNLWKKNKVFIERPPRLYCNHHMITGECDDLRIEDGKLFLIDYKTPLRESKMWALQGSAYAYMARLQGYHIECIEFVKLCKNGSYPEVYTYEENFSLFLSYLDVYRHSFKKDMDDDVHL